MELDREKIGKRIKKERKEAGFSNQSDFAEAMNLSRDSRQSVANWENGKSLPWIENLYKMCDMFNCELGYLLCEYDCKTRAKTDVQAVTGLSEEAIDAICEITTSSFWADENEETLNKLIAAKAFNGFFRALVEMYNIYEMPKQKVFKLYDDAIDYMRNLEFEKKLGRYEIKESLTLLIEEMFPKRLPCFQELNIMESYDGWLEREEKHYNYLSEQKLSDIDIKIRR